MKKSTAFRLDNECAAKLDYEAKKLGMSKTAYMEQLIMNGEVKILYNGKKIVEIVARVHDGMNQNTMAIRKDLTKLNNEIEKLEKNCGANENARRNSLVIRLSTLLDKIEEKYTSDLNNAEMEIKKQCRYLR